MPREQSGLSMVTQTLKATTLQLNQPPNLVGSITTFWLCILSHYCDNENLHIWFQAGISNFKVPLRLGSFGLLGTCLCVS